jgi:hypothetical protein
MKPILTLFFLLITASLLFAEKIHLKNGKVIEAQGAKTNGVTLIIQIQGGEIEVMWDELTEADGRKFFPKLFAEMDRVAREEAQRVQRERDKQERERLEAEHQAYQREAEERARVEEEFTKRSAVIQQQLDKESELGVTQLTGSVLQITNGGFLFNCLTREDAGKRVTEAMQFATLDDRLQLAGAARFVQDRGGQKMSLNELQPLGAKLSKLIAAAGLADAQATNLLAPPDPRDMKLRFIVGFPKQKNLADDSELTFRAYRDGTFSYTDVRGTQRTVEKWVYWEFPEVQLPKEPRQPSPSRVTQPKPPPQPQQTACIVCRGSGWNGVVKCSTCNGTGYVKRK